VLFCSFILTTPLHNARKRSGRFLGHPVFIMCFSISKSSLFFLSEKSVLSSNTCSVGIDYTEEPQLPAHLSSCTQKPDEVFLLPHEQAVHKKLSADITVTCSDVGGSFEELDHLAHIDTDMSSLLQVMDCHLVHNDSPRRFSTSDDLSSIEVDPALAATASDTGSHQLDVCCFVDKATFHEYDSIYVPHNDATAMARRVDNETSYVRTLQSKPRNCSPYEEVRFEGRRPLFLTDRAPNQQPFAPPRTSSVTNSHMQNPDCSGIIIECQVDETDVHGDCHS